MLDFWKVVVMVGQKVFVKVDVKDILKAVQKDTKSENSSGGMKESLRGKMTAVCLVDC